ncbi:MAG: zinc ribbon domain-containing protein [Tenericutes bacterium]|nr:zinc ribbon domain-containing protein [Mycoplasmatota bacterium]
MNCKKCGYQLNIGDMFCKSCGEKVDQIIGDPTGVNGNTLQPQQKFLTPESEPVMHQPVQDQVVQQPAQLSIQEQLNQQPTQQPMQAQLNQQQMQAQLNQQPMQAQMTSQPTYNQQPMYNNPAPEQKNKIVPVLVGLVVVLVVALAVVLGLNFIKIEDNTISVNVDGYTYKIPNNLVYSVTNDSLYITNKEETWLIIAIAAKNQTYSEYISKKSFYVSSIESMGAKVNKAEEKKVLKRNYLVFDVDFNSENFLMAITDADALNSLIVELYTSSNTADYTLLENLSKILKGVKVSDNSSKAKFNSTLIDKLNTSPNNEIDNNETNNEIDNSETNNDNEAQ